MAFMMLSLAVTVLCVLGVQGVCEPEVVKKIYELWEGNPPYDILPQLVGNQTYLYYPAAKESEIIEGLKCYKTELDLDKETTTDYQIFDDPKKNNHFSYKMVEEEKGIVTNINPDYEDHMYIVYFKHQVCAIYQCGDSYDSFIYISVLNYDQKNLKQTTAVGEATLKLTSLGKRFLKKLDPSDCSDD